MLKKFSDLEMRTVQCAMRGLTRKEIAEELSTTVAAVRCTLWRVYRKLGVKSKSQMIYRVGIEMKEG